LSIFGLPDVDNGVAPVAFGPMSKPVGPYTPLVRAGDFLIASGQIGLGPEGLVAGGMAAELRQAMSNLRALVESAGSSLSDVVKTTVFLIEMADYAEMNEIYCDEFGDHRPARSAVAVAALPLGASVEVEAWLHVPLSGRI